ncbi:sialate O-acetylesterase [Lyngbya aestuarii]|nr:sialate O-acetylesterase [Lyngbya aestuarii]
MKRESIIFACFGLMVLFLLSLNIEVNSSSTESLHLPSIIADHMILQQQTNVAIWGWDKPGNTVTVQFRDHEVKTTVEVDGKWQVKIPSGKAGGPFNLTIQGSQLITLKDVLVGEVWVAGGQSNMWWFVSRSDNSQQEISQANFPHIRVWDANTSPQENGWPANTPQKTIPAKWELTTPKTVKNFPATAYFFAKELHQKLNVPIGIVHLAVPNREIETFLSQPLLAANFPETLAFWRLQKDSKTRPAQLFNGMVYPAIPYTPRGFIWWQGESNAKEAMQYRTLFPSLIQEWRSLWGNDNAPFLFVELANFLEKQTYPSEDDPWPRLRSAQKEALKLPNTAMISTIDILDENNNFNNIHPPNKQLAGKRLFLAAMATVYGQKDLVWSGPVYQSVEFKENQAIVTFDSAGKGLKIKGDQLKGFAVAGSNHRFFWADGKIEGNRVILTSEAVKQPVAVRYGWANNPIGNLYNSAELPAFPFRTDNWLLNLDESRFEAMSLVELAAYIQTNILPIQPEIKSVWDEVYQAIKTDNKPLANQRLKTLINQPLEDEKLAIALEIISEKLRL